MKLRYIFATLIASLALFASCNDDKDLAVLSNLQVSKSFVSIPAEGGSDIISLHAKDDWKIYTKDKQGVLKDSIPEWMNISPASGNAGDAEITFSAEATTKSYSSMVYLTCGDQTQMLNVVQQTEAAEVPLSSCAQVLAGPDDDTYRVKGTVTKILKQDYGNLYINDGTGEVYVYGTLDANGNTKNFSSWGIEVGDEITIQGPKTTYNGTIELVNVSVISINKSLIKVDSLSVDNLPKEGGEIIAYLTVKGEGVSVEVPEEAQDWLSVKSIITSGTTAKVTFKATANEKGNRTASLKFITTKDGKEYTSTSELTQEGSIVECNIDEFNSAAAGTTIYRLTGVINKVANDNYGNCYITDATGETYVYGMGAKGEFKDKGLKVGDIVTITGVKDEYKGVGQMKNASIEVIKPVTPITVEEFLKKEDNADVYYLLTGKVANIKSTTYGNYDLVDATGSVYIYGTLAGWGGASKQWASFGINEGDEISIITVKTSYNGTAQGKNAMLFKAKE